MQFSAPFFTLQRSLARVERPSHKPPADMLFFAITGESLLFFADRIGFFAMKSWKGACLRSFHFALSLKRTASSALAQRTLIEDGLKR
jgi:hypothetical protein